MNIDLTHIMQFIQIWWPKILKIFLILAITWVSWRFIVSILHRIIDNSQKNHQTAFKRNQTMAAIVQNVMAIFLMGLAITLVLDEVGIKIGPFLAAAGVAGIAIGLGAQSIVKDMLNGFFLLLEGQVRIGDWIETAGKAGWAEEITTRIITLRDREGNLHIIPHSEVRTITNRTKGYSMVSVDVGVAYKENSKKVIHILEQIGLDIAKEKKYIDNVFEPPEVLSIQEFGESAVMHTVRMKVKAGQQWNIAREYRLRIKERFDEEKISIPFPHRTLFMHEVKDSEN